MRRCAHTPSPFFCAASPRQQRSGLLTGPVWTAGSDLEACLRSPNTMETKALNALLSVRHTSMLVLCTTHSRGRRLARTPLSFLEDRQVFR